MPTKQYQVRVPAPLVERYGKEILSERFHGKAFGLKWKADRKQEFAEQLAELELPGDAKKAGMKVRVAVTFRQAAAGWLKSSDVPPATKAWYKILVEVHLMPILRDVDIADIGRVRILDTMDRRKHDGASKDAMSKDLWALKAVLIWARDRGHTVDPSAWAVKRRKPLPALTRRFEPENVERFLDGLDGRSRAALEVAAGTGLRQGELRALRVEWIRWLEGRIHVPADEEWAPKNYKERSIPIHKRLKAWLLKAAGDRATGLLFEPMTGGDGIYLRGIIQQGRQAWGVTERVICPKCRARAGSNCKTSKGVECTPHAARALADGLHINGMHDFRHHYASMLVMAGEDIRVIQEILGHADIATTRRYMQLRDNYVTRAGAALNRLSSKLSSALKQKRPRAM